MNAIPNPYETLFRKLEEMHEELTALRAQVAAINSTLPEWCSYTQAADYIDNGRTTARALSTAKSSGKIPEWATDGAGKLHREWVKAYRETGDYARAEHVAAQRLP